MKTVLIVEDEKLIRQGIKAMVKRSGVPVEVVMECENGEMALEIVKSQKIDVMFTDIRMPKMDGIELVHRIAECRHIPIIVVISGYDDFSYAVEMLRNGVREYLLKPVQREKIKELLYKFEEELEEKKQQRKTETQIGYQQLKYLFMQGRNISEEELDSLQQKYEDYFYKDPYVVCVFGKQTEFEADHSVIYLEDVGEGKVCIVEEKNRDQLLQNFQDVCVGISQTHQGLLECRQAYDEACQARKLAFCSESNVEFGQSVARKVPEGLKIEAAKLLDEQARMQRLQMIGTDKTEELSTTWEHLFEETRRGRIEPGEFFDVLQSFLDEVGKIYRNVMTEEDETIKHRCQRALEFNSLGELQECLLDWILDIHDRIQNQMDTNRNQLKMKLAVEYIHENYNHDLNMAVVSNYISMNYSLFSFSFKQYTGSNFVNYLKDIRIKEAKRLLSETDMKIVEISQSVGYDNEKHFMKIFKSTCGVSPSEYRKNMRLENEM